MKMLCGAAPRLISRSMQAVAAAPAPMQTMRLVPISLALHFQRVEQPGGGDDGGTVLVIVEHRDVAAGDQRLFNLEALGALMSSRLMPPKVSAMAATVSMNWALVSCFTSMSMASMRQSA